MSSSLSTKIDIKEYDYPLPAERIAKHPLAERDACKLLVYNRGVVQDHRFSRLPELLPAGSLLVRNVTKVIKARLFFTKETGAKIEVFCLEPARPHLYELALAATAGCTWHCLVGNARRWRPGQVLHQTVTSAADGGTYTLTAERREEIAPDAVCFGWSRPELPFASVLEDLGQLPIPPYLKRETQACDLQDYQTVYAQIAGSVAAPTAGLHFTPRVIEEVLAAGHRIADLTLHVGAGTFLPVKEDDVREHAMHKEFCSVSVETLRALHAQADRPIIPVGTTSVRTLESLYRLAVQLSNASDAPSDSAVLPSVPQWSPYETSTREPLPSRTRALETLIRYCQDLNRDTLTFTTSLIIVPGYRYRFADGLITNFHQPQSTLLLLVAALIGEDWKRCYEHALAGDYRFLSYGDASLLLPKL